MLSIALHPFTRQYTTAICSTFPSFRSMWFYYAQPSQPKKQVSKKQTTNRHKINKQTNKQASKQTNKQRDWQKTGEQSTRTHGVSESEKKTGWEQTSQHSKHCRNCKAICLPAYLPTCVRYIHICDIMIYIDILHHTTQHIRWHDITWQNI